MKLPLRTSPLLPGAQVPQVPALWLVNFLNNYELDLILEKGQKPNYRGVPFRLPKVERLWHFVLDLQEFERICKAKGYPWGVPSDVLPKLGAKAGTIYKRIESSIATLRPLAQLILPTENGWRVTFVARENYPTKTLWYDYVARIMVLDAAVNGDINKIKKCAKCSFWFVPKRKEIHKFCSPACRDKAYRQHPEAKRRAAERQRLYRENLKKRDEANLRMSARRRK